MKDKWNFCSVFQFPADIGLFVVCSPDDALLAFLDASFFLIAFSKVEDGYNCHMLSLYGTVIVLSSTANTGTGRTLIYCCHYLLYRCIQSRCVQTHPLIICCGAENYLDPVPNDCTHLSMFLVNYCVGQHWSWGLFFIWVPQGQMGIRFVKCGIHLNYLGIKSDDTGRQSIIRYWWCQCCSDLQPIKQTGDLLLNSSVVQEHKSSLWQATCPHS